MKRSRVPTAPRFRGSFGMIRRGVARVGVELHGKASDRLGEVSPMPQRKPGFRSIVAVINVALGVGALCLVGCDAGGSDRRTAGAAGSTASGQAGGTPTGAAGSGAAG